MKDDVRICSKVAIKGYKNQICVRLADRRHVRGGGR